MIHAHCIGVTYSGGITALHPTSIGFLPRQFTVLLGPSGAGKSTLLRCLNHLCKPNHGHVHVDGLGQLNSGALLRRHRINTAMIFQQHQLIVRQTALQNVLVGRIGHHSWLRSLFPLPKTEVLTALECLDRVGLLHKAMERVDNLSGGEQQRIGVARALAQKPGIILADEPVASLDPATAHRVLILLHEISRREGISVVVSLHQVDMARKFADRIVGLAGGRVVFDGSPAELTEDVVNKIYIGGIPRNIPIYAQYKATGEDPLSDLATIES